jgi:N-acetyl-1-D-myo-inositol-2-amino-2-deoxy-alpha-D-glucopyranoside deacetylase
MNESIIAVFAHPDDETLVSGTLAMYAERGARVTVLCATRGEVGQIAEGSGATAETLGAFREQELRDAMAILGVQDVRFLDYRDSGMKGTPENDDPRAFWKAPADEVVTKIAATFADVRPTAVLTWDPTGGYGHPDHVAIHQHATAAFEAYARDARGPAALFYALIPVDDFAKLRAEMKERGIDFEGPGDPDAIPSTDEVLPANCIIDVAPYFERKMEAFRAHRTQAQDFTTFADMPDDIRRRLFGRELYHRVAPPVPDGVVYDALVLS